MTRIALFGKMAAGKTTIASVLGEMEFQRVSFAGPLKKIAEMAYGPIDKGKSYGIIDARTGGYTSLGGRAILQRLGQSVKDADRDFWLRCFYRDIERREDQDFVVDDGRFRFERDSLRDNGFVVVGVNAPEPIRIQRYTNLYGREPTREELEHGSETEVDEIFFDVDLIVQGTEDPYWNVRKIMEYVNGRVTTPRQPDGLHVPALQDGGTGAHPARV